MNSVEYLKQWNKVSVTDTKQMPFIILLVRLVYWTILHTFVSNIEQKLFQKKIQNITFLKQKNITVLNNNSSQLIWCFISNSLFRSCFHISKRNIQPHFLSYTLAHIPEIAGPTLATSCGCIARPTILTLDLAATINRFWKILKFIKY